MLTAFLLGILAGIFFGLFWIFRQRLELPSDESDPFTEDELEMREFME